MKLSLAVRLMHASTKIAQVIAAVSVFATSANAEVVYWSQTDTTPYKVIASVSTDHCVLTGFSGKFMGTGEQVGIWRDANYWYIGGKSQQQGVNAYAYCFPRSKFTSSAPGAVRWSSDDLRLARNGQGCHSATKLAWWGDAMTAVARISGALRGLGERVEVQQSMSANLPSQLVTSTCKGVLDVTAHSLFIGKPGGVKPMIGAGPDGNPFPVGHEFVLDHDGEVAMSNAKTSACYLTGISGTFNGNGESVRIAAWENDNRWRLIVKHGSGQGVRAKARCIMFDQG